MSTRLTAAQLEIWLAQQLEPSSAKYNLCEYLDIAGPIDEERFERAVREAVAEVDSLNVRLTSDEDGTPRQLPAADVAWPFRFMDLGGTDDPPAAATSWMTADAQTPTELTGPPLAGALIKINRRRYFWYQRYHHIAVDGFGMALIARQVAHRYSALDSDRVPNIHRLGSTADALCDDDRYAGSVQYKKDGDYWRDRLADWEGPTTLGRVSAPAASVCLRGSIRLPEKTVARMRRTCAALGTSVPRLLTTATAVYVRHVSGNPDVSLSFVMGAREGNELAPVTMANIVPLRLRIAARQTLAQVIEAVAGEIRAAKAHQRYRCEDIRRHCLPRGHGPTFGPMVNIYRFDYGFDFAGHHATATNLATGPIDDISFSFHDRSDGNGITVIAEANPRRYAREMVEDHLRRLVRVLDQLIDAPSRLAVEQIGIVTEEERSRMLTELSRDPDPAVPPPRRVHELFEERARENPEATAVISGGSTLSYAELNARANRLARHLIAMGVDRGHTVAVFLHRNPELVAALLAIWKAGAAYVPVDTTYPRERVGHILDDARPFFMLTSAAVEEDMPRRPGELRMALETEDTVRLLRRYPATNPDRTGNPRDVAYVIYTSGSTGRPKGVAVEHRSVHTYLHHALTTYPGLADSAVVHSPVSFDLTVTGLFGPLIAGGSVTLTSRLGENHDGTPGFVKATPAHLPHLDTIAAADAPSGSLVLGGEQLLWESLANWRRANPRAAVFNEYGPTEATVGCCVYRIDPGESQGTGAVPIGRPISGVRLYVLDSMLRPLPPGMTGELYIGGHGLARGYVNQLVTTAERFVADPFGPPGSRMYRTGDQVVWRSDGNLEFRGRVDTQVKVRGYRVELGEIEAVLTEHPTVGAAVAVAEPVGDLDHRIVAYVAAHQGGPVPEVEGLGEWAAARLPEYMTPHTFLILDEIPLTANGKVDRRRLPSTPDRSTGAAGTGGRTSDEDLLCGLFAGVLGRPEVNVHDDFFNLGGSSLTGIQLVSRVRGALGRGFTIADLFRFRTPARLAARLAPHQPLPDLRPVPRADRASLSYAQQRLWYLAQLHGDTRTYHLRRAYRLRGRLDPDVLCEALADVLNRHEITRTVIRADRGRPYQVTLPVGDRTWFTAMAVSEPEVRDTLVQLSGAPFDLAHDFPIRVNLLSVSDGDHVLLITMHHGAGDAWSFAPLCHDIDRAYTARAQGKSPDWPALPLRYADYAAWQRTVFNCSAAAASQEKFWAEALAGAPEQTGPRTDRPRPEIATHRGHTVPFALPADIHSGLIQLARAADASLFMAVHAGLLLVLAGTGPAEDLVIGTPTAGRTHGQLHDLVGCFLNTIPLRTNVSAKQTLGELLARVRETDLSALAHQDVPFDRIVEVVKPPRSLARHPIFQVMLAFNNTPEAPLCLPGIELSEVPVDSETAKFDLTLDVTEHRDAAGRPAGIAGTLEYATDIFEYDTACALSERLEHGCAGLAAAEPDRLVGDLMPATLPEKTP